MMANVCAVDFVIILHKFERKGTNMMGEI